MALITCPECKKKMSESADSCPHCGYKLTPEKADQIKKAENEKHMVGGIASLIVLVSVIILLVVYKLNSHSDGPDGSNNSSSETHSQPSSKSEGKTNYPAFWETPGQESKESTRYVILPDGSRAKIPKEFYGKYWLIDDYNKVIRVQRELDRMYEAAQKTGNMEIWYRETTNFLEAKSNLMYLEIRESRIEIVPQAELRSLEPEHRLFIQDFEVEVINPRTVRFTYSEGKSMEVELRKGNNRVITLRENEDSREFVRFAGEGKP